MTRPRAGDPALERASSLRGREARSAGRKQQTLVLGVVVAPGLAHELTAEIVVDLERDLRDRYSAVHWEIELAVDRLVEPGARITEILEAGRENMLEARRDLQIVVTDLPLRVGRRPVTRQVSPTYGVAVVSLPALGAMQLRRRLRRALVDVVGELIGEKRPRAGAAEGRWQRGLLRELTTDTDQRPRGLALLYVPAVLFGNLRLLIGMVRANRPWRFAARLYSALIAAFAAGVFSLVFSDHWRIATSMGWWRLAILSVVAIAAGVLGIVAVHHLWERAPDPRVRDQVVLFNVATGATIAIGLLSLYAVLFVFMLAGAALIVTPGLLEHEVGSEAGVQEYAQLVWFQTSLATVGGGLGAALESDEAVREAAYAPPAKARAGQPARRGGRRRRGH